MQNARRTAEPGLRPSAEKSGAFGKIKKLPIIFDFFLDNSLFVPHLGPVNARSAPDAPPSPSISLRAGLRYAIGATRDEAPRYGAQARLLGMRRVGNWTVLPCTAHPHPEQPRMQSGAYRGTYKCIRFLSFFDTICAYRNNVLDRLCPPKALRCKALSATSPRRARRFRQFFLQKTDRSVQFGEKWANLLFFRPLRRNLILNDRSKTKWTDRARKMPHAPDAGGGA